MVQTKIYNNLSYATCLTELNYSMKTATERNQNLAAKQSPSYDTMLAELYQEGSPGRYQNLAAGYLTSITS